MAKNIVVERGDNARPDSAHVMGKQTVVWRHEDDEKITIDFKTLGNVPFSDWNSYTKKTGAEVTGTVNTGIEPGRKFKYKAKQAHKVIKPGANSPELIVDGGVTNGLKKKGATKTARKAAKKR
jgi:hypothetical protein